MESVQLHRPARNAIGADPIHPHLVNLRPAATPRVKKDAQGNVVAQNSLQDKHQPKSDDSKTVTSRISAAVVKTRKLIRDWHYFVPCHRHIAFVLADDSY
jgi:hypothetical protein